MMFTISAASSFQNRYKKQIILFARKLSDSAVELYLIKFTFGTVSLLRYLWSELCHSEHATCAVGGAYWTGLAPYFVWPFVRNKFSIRFPFQKNLSLTIT